MRRAVQTLVVGGALLLAAACGTSQSPSDGTAPKAAPAVSGGAAQPAALTQTKTWCEALGQVYNKNMGPLAQSLTDMVAAKNSKPSVEKAQAALKSFATAVRTATKDSADAQLRADGAETADALVAKSGDATYFKAIKTGEDVNKTLGPTLKEWLSPVMKHCS